MLNKTFALLLALALLLTLGGFSALAETEEPELIVADEDVEAIDLLPEVDIGSTELVDVGDLALLEDTQNSVVAPNAAKPQGVKVDSKNFPDAKFRKFVKEELGGEDGVLTKAEIKKVTTIDVNSRGISSLKGIEHFTSLQHCYFWGNKVTSANLSKNTKLIDINAQGNKLTKLDVSGCKALTELVVGENKLKKLNLTKNTKLQVLLAWNNQLTALDLTKNKALKTLNISENKLKKLDLSKNAKLDWMDISTNPLTVLDLTKNTKLVTLYVDHTKLTALKLTKNTKLKELHCEDNKLTTLNVTKCSALKVLFCYDNALKALDLSKNTRLINLHCGKNRLEGLDVSKCKKLETLYCEENAIPEIDIAKLSAYLRNLIRDSGLTVDGSVMFNMPEEGKGIHLDASVRVYDGEKLIHAPEEA